MSDSEDFARANPSARRSSAARTHILSGEAEYTDDIQFPDGVHLALCRSQYGHARIDVNRQRFPDSFPDER